MKALIVLAHPNPKSFSAAIASTVGEQLRSNGVEVKIKDLYREKFNPILTHEDLGGIFSGKIPAEIKKEQDAVAWADRLIFVYPIWWLTTPAILKGWLERVLCFGFAYSLDKTGPKGLLKHDKNLVIQMCGSPRAAYEAKNWAWALKPSLIERDLEFCGLNNVTVYNCEGVGSSTPEQRTQWLSDVQGLVKNWK